MESKVRWGILSTAKIGVQKVIPALQIRNQADIGGGALMDIGCYCISFPRFIFGKEPEMIVSDMDFEPTDQYTLQGDAFSKAIL